MIQRNLHSRKPEYFEAIYAANPDPWNFVTSAYEREKYQATISALEGQHFANALEIGCSIGVLTKILAGSCSSLLAVDITESALAPAKKRCEDLPQVEFQRLQVPYEWPANKKFDLILYSEVLYFLTQADIEHAATLSRDSLLSNGVILLVNYTEDIDEPCNGNEAAEIFIRSMEKNATLVKTMKHDKFRIDLLKSLAKEAKQNHERQSS